MIDVTTLTIEGDYFELIALGDLHYGAKGQTRHMIKKALKEADKKTEAGIPCKVISIGDNLDNAIKYAEGGEDSPEGSADMLADDFRPYVEKGIVLGFIEGNHDRNVTRYIRAKCDLVRSKVAEWNEIYRSKIFYSIAHLLIIKMKPVHTSAKKQKTRSIAILLHHGFGGGRTIGTIYNNLEKLLGILMNPDIIIGGHRHVEGHVVIGRFMFSHSTNTIVKKEVHLVSTGANLEDADYAMRFGLPPSIPSNSLIKIKLLDPLRNKDFSVQVEGMR